MKIVLRVVPFSIFLFALISCGRSDGDRITKVLNQCATVAQRSAGIPGGPGAKADFVTREFQKIDVSNCPSDFRMAYQAHVFAWQQAAAPLSNNNAATAFLEGAASGLSEDPRYMGQAAQQAQFATQQINSTYFELTQIAARHGARIPQSEVR